MPRNNSGTYAAPASAWNPAVDGVTMSTDDWNTLLADVSTALTNSIALDGQTSTTARIPFSQGISVAGGSVGAPALGFIGSLTSGLYQPTTDQVGLAAAGVSAFNASATAANLPLATTAAALFTANAGISTTTLTASGAVSAAGAFSCTNNAIVGGSGKTVGFYAASGTTKQTVTGSRGSNAALASLITILAGLGLVIDGSS